MRRRLASVLAFGMVFALVPSAHDVITTPITFSREISRLVYRRCAQCHRARGMAFPLMTYAQALAVLDYSRTLLQSDGGPRPAFAGGAVGSECNLVVLDASDVLHDAFAVRGPSIDAEGEVSSQCAHVAPFLSQSASISIQRKSPAPGVGGA